MPKDIIIRPWRKEDAAHLTTIANNKNIWLNVRDRFPHPYTLKHAIDWIAITQKQTPTQSFAILYKGRIAGTVGILLKDDVYRKSMEIGYFVGEEFWGKGIVTRAVALLLEYIREHYNVTRIYAEVFEHNRASMKVLEKNGFTLESVRKKAVIKNDVLMDDYVWVKFL